MHSDPKDSVDRAIDALATDQRGRVTRGQLRLLGLSDEAIDYRVGAGRLQRAHRAVYSVGHRAGPRDAAWLAAVFALGPTAVLSHLAAAALWEIYYSDRPLTDVSLPSYDGRDRRDGIRVHRVKLRPQDCTVEMGIPVTTMARTIVDLATVLPARQVVVALDRMERREPLDLPAVGAAMALFKKRKGLPALRAHLEERHPDSRLLDTGLERLALDLIEGAGLPRPSIQHPVLTYYLDLAWPAQRIALEVDGPWSHTTKADREADARRQAEIEAMGWVVLRATRDELVDAPWLVLARLREALAAADFPPSP